MSKAEGRKIAVKFTLPINPLVLTPTIVIGNDYSTPSGTVTYSNQYSTTYSAIKAFDNNTSTYWQTRATLPQWNMIELAEAKQIAGFRLYSGTSYRPNSVDLYGSNDGTNFDLISQTTNANATGWKENTFDATIPYKFYKWVVNSTHTAGRVYIYEFQLLFATTTTRSGNEEAFTITGQEYQWLNGPDHNGELISKNYPVLLAQTHPTEPNSILLDVAEFRNVVGGITISYNQEFGTLAGAGGVVASFTETFIPTDLMEGLTTAGVSVGGHDYIEALVGGSIDFIYITKPQAYSTDYIEATIGGTIQLIHIDDINP